METPNLFADVLASILALSGWEALATLLGIGYILFAIKQSIWAWPCAFFSTFIYTLLFWDGQLPLQSVLNAYYLVMAIYGFWLWKKPIQSEKAIHVHTKPVAFHLEFLVIGTILTVTIGLYMQQGDYSRAPFLDAGVMVFSVMNTYLMARKVLENWLYWLVINSAAIVLYWQSGFYFTILMFILYFGLAIAGYRAWRQDWIARQVAHN